MVHNCVWDLGPEPFGTVSDMMAPSESWLDIFAVGPYGISIFFAKMYGGPCRVESLHICDIKYLMHDGTKLVWFDVSGALVCFWDRTTIRNIDLDQAVLAPIPKPILYDFTVVPDR